MSKECLDAGVGKQLGLVVLELEKARVGASVLDTESKALVLRSHTDVLSLLSLQLHGAGPTRPELQGLSHKSSFNLACNVSKTLK